MNALMVEARGVRKHFGSAKILKGSRPAGRARVRHLPYRAVGIGQDDLPEVHQSPRKRRLLEGFTSITS